MIDKVVRTLVTWFYGVKESVQYFILLFLLSILYFILWNGFFYIHSNYHDPLSLTFGGEHIHKIIEFIFCLVLAFVSLSANALISKRKINKIVNDNSYSDEKLSNFERRVDQLTQALGNREKALRASNRQRGAMLNAIPDLIMQLDKNGTIRCWSGPIGDLYVKPEDMLGNNINEYMPIEVANLGMKHIRQAIATDKLQIFEYDLTLRGEINTFEARMAKMDDDNVVLIARNITEIRKIEARNLRQSNMFKHMADNLPEMLWSKDLAGRYVFVNRLYTEIFLEEGVDVTGKRIDSAIVNKETAKNILETDVIVMRDKAPKRFLVKHKLTNGTEMWLDVYKSPWWSVNVPKRIIGTVGSARDITNCMPTMSKRMLNDITMVEVSFDQCFHWSSDDPACNTCMASTDGGK